MIPTSNGNGYRDSSGLGYKGKGVASPSEEKEGFGFQFPSLDEFEGNAFPSTLPSISTSQESFVQPSRLSRGPLPPPPKPFDMSSPEFSNQTQARAAAMAKLSSTNNGSTTDTFTGISNPSIPQPAASPLALPAYSTEITPHELYSSLQHLHATGVRGKILLLDVRSREEYERGNVGGECLCLEPVTLRFE